MFGISLYELIIIIIISFLFINPKDFKQIIKNILSLIEKIKSFIDSQKRQLLDLVQDDDKKFYREVIDVFGKKHIVKIDDINNDLSKDDINQEITKYNKINNKNKQ